MGFRVKERACSGETGVNSANALLSSEDSETSSGDDAATAGSDGVVDADVVVAVGVVASVFMGGGNGVEGVVAAFDETATALGRVPTWNEARAILLTARAWGCCLKSPVETPPRRAKLRSMV